MEREILINEITNFCIQYGVFNQEFEISEIKESIEKYIEDSEFIENLINTIIIRTKYYYKNVDIRKVMELLIELERIRLEIEFKNSNEVEKEFQR